MRDRLLKPAIDHRRLGQFLTGDWVKNIPALTQLSEVLKSGLRAAKYSFSQAIILKCQKYTGHWYIVEYQHKRKRKYR
jgi:hypothetical protein